MTEIDPNDLAEIAILLARGYLRYRDSLRRQLPNCLDSVTGIEPHVPVVNGTEKKKDTAEPINEEGA